jgi:3-oxoacyl-[acyl-carrier protein] reductase
MSRAFDRIDGRCVLCGKTREQVEKLILGVHGGVCLECVELCNDIIRSNAKEQQAARAAKSETANEAAAHGDQAPHDVKLKALVTQPDSKQLAGKVALVTGASRGIGAAIARRLAADGAQVVVNYSRSAAAAERVAADIATAGGEAVTIHADVIDLQQVKKLFTEVKRSFGRLHILVNNAGVAEFRPLENVDEAHFALQFYVNVRGLLFATQEAARAFGAEGGRIINISSGAAQAAPPNTSVYSATKAAVDTLTRSHAAELGPRGITVNAVAPGLTTTDMLAAVIPSEVQQAMIATTALRRLGTPEDIADVVAFLASEEARWITGQVIGVNGGLR